MIMSRIYSIDQQTSGDNHAGAKAPADVSEICRSMGMESFPFPTQKYAIPHGKKEEVLGKVWLLKTCSERWKKLERLVEDGDVVLVQHPLYGTRAALHYIPEIKEKKKCRFVVLIHDLESLRSGISGLYAKSEKTAELSDNELLRHFDMIICHNEHMKAWLTGRGFDPERIVCLEIFDYLTQQKMITPRRHENPTLVVAGNLHPGKSGYLYDFFREQEKTGRETKTEMNLYGVNFDRSRADRRMHYMGSFPADILPGKLDGDFGLVWDGPSAETCTGNTGEYLRYNNPHKTSLYLASGLPVLVWKQAAVADFVLAHHAGIAVESLYEADEAIRRITDEEYAALCAGARETGKKLRSGFYFRTAFQTCMDRMHSE